MHDAVAHAAQPVLEQIDAGALPGAAFGAVTATGERAVVVHGAAQLEPEHVPLRRDTVFDLASLTKVLFTTAHVLRLGVDLDAPLAEYIPDFRQHDPAAPERRFTVRQCLTHQTTFPAFEPLYTLGLDPATLRAHILHKPWPAGPPVYSDINFLLLGILLERVTGSPLSELPAPPGMTFAPEPARCAATEHCPWRGRVLRGEVHDENAFAMGGAAGHAGLFGSIDAVLDAGLALLADPPPLRRETPERTLGWQMPRERAIAHTGFTGTSLCVDFDRGLAYALLSNRVHPTRHRPNGLPQLRIDTEERLLAKA